MASPYPAAATANLWSSPHSNKTDQTNRGSKNEISLPRFITFIRTGVAL
ncbi:unknown [Prevotella sp. CAG:873]|nr:unknown [Prevotella sp. CAG:873]